MGIAALTILFLSGAPARPASQDSIQSLIRDLGAEDYDVRERATWKLLEMGKTVVPLLRVAARRARDPEIRVRAHAVADTLAWARAELSCERTTFKLGEFRWPEVRLTNETTRSLRLRPVECCVVQSSIQFRAWWEVIDPEGKSVEHSWDNGIPRVIAAARGGDASKRTDLVVVKPGEPWNPIKMECFSCFSSVTTRAWAPVSPGTYRIRFVYDDLCDWGPYSEVHSWLLGVRHGRVDSNWVEITVTE